MQALLIVLGVGLPLALSVGIGVELWLAGHEPMAILAAPIPLTALLQWCWVRRKAFPAVPLGAGQHARAVEVVPLRLAAGLFWIAVIASAFVYYVAELARGN